jgi:starch synthase
MEHQTEWHYPMSGLGKMKVLYVSAEVAPFAKVGGLADVAAGLPKAIKVLGHDCRVILPFYQMIADNPRWKTQAILESFEVQMNPVWAKTASLHQLDFEGMTYYLIQTDEWFTEAKDSSSMYQPGGEVHAFFVAATLRAMELIHWIPDVIHANDWHTGFLPVLLKEKVGPIWNKTGSIYTIHNMAYQGEFGIEALDWLNLSHDLYNYEQVEAWGQVNFMKAGMSFSDVVNTVSPTYALEIQTGEYGCGLDGLNRFLSENDRLFGVLNGLDYDVWNPKTDPRITANFSASQLDGKRACREALMELVGFAPISGAPLVGMISRISTQKGFDLLVTAAEELFALPIQMVVQGLGDPQIIDGLRVLEQRFPNQFRFLNAFDEELAQQIYSGCDAFLMPSSFEPCGLGQLIAMRYGTVPIVRATGGLRDTVIEGKNGFVFDNQSRQEFIDAVTRAYAAFATPEWDTLVANGMNADFGWAASAKQYVELYEKALKRRARHAMAPNRCA